MKTKPVLFSANALAKQLGLTGDTVLRLYRDDVIDAEIHEGRLIRFDIEKVRVALAKRAKRNRHSVATPSDLVPLIVTSLLSSNPNHTQP